MNYTDQIKHPKWQKKRLEILKKDKFKCQICGDNEKTLHVHHIFYEQDKMIWEYPNAALITLCCDCHNREHELSTQIRFPNLYYLTNKRLLTYHEIDAILEIINEGVYMSPNYITGRFSDDSGVFNYNDFKGLEKRRNKLSSKINKRRQ